MNYAKIPYKSTINLYRGSSTRSLLYCWNGGCKHSYRRKTNISSTMEVYNLSRQQCQRSRSNYRYKEIEEGESSNSLTTWAKFKGLNFLVHNAETNFGRQSLSHHYAPVSTLEECVVKVVKENGHFSGVHTLRVHFTSHACCTHAWLKGAKKVHCMCVTSFRLAFSLSHVSAVFAVPARSLRDHSRLRLHWRSRPHVLAILTCP